MHTHDDKADEVLATITASGPRRVFGIVSVGALGALFLAMAVTTPVEPALRFGLAIAAAATIWGAVRMYRATEAVLELTRHELRERGGEVLARVDDVARVDRSMFAMKPSNGFVLVLTRPGARAWRPGLWWRIGRRVAVGGVTSGSQTRPVADMIAALKDGQI